MRTAPIQVTFLHGRPIVAYLQLSDASDRLALRTEELEPGLVVDFGRRGEPLGLEIIDPPRATLAAVNRVLRRLKRGKITSRDLKPMHAG